MNLLNKTIGRLRRKPQFYYLIIVTRTLDDLLPTYQSQLPLDFELLSSEVSEVKTKIAHIPVEHRSDIERRISDGDRCYAATYKNRTIFVSWTAFGKCYSYALDREYELADSAVYLYSAYTLPEFRGNGIYPAANCHRLQLLKDWGYKRDIAFMEPKNFAAMRMPEKLGYSKVGVTGFIEMFGFRWYFHKDHGIFSDLKKRDYWRKM